MSGDLAISHVTVVTMQGALVLRDQTVVIANGRIVAMRSADSLRVAEGVRTVDGRGRFLLPAFADTHTHICDTGDFDTFLAYGVGAVRNMEGTPFHLLIRDANRHGTLDGPWVGT